MALDEAKIQELKAKYGEELYSVEINDETFVFRKLNRIEWKEIFRVATDNLKKEEMVCAKCVVYPENFNEVTMSVNAAGLPTTLTDQILEKSGFNIRTEAVKI